MSACSGKSDGNLTKLKLLVENDVSLEETDDEFDTAMTLCAKFGNEKMVQFLLDSGLGANDTGSEGKTAFLSACSNKGNSNTLSLLLDDGCNPEVKDDNGDNAIITGWFSEYLVFLG